MKALNILKNKAYAFAIVLLTSATMSTAALAGSADFAGINVGISASVNGASMSGTHSAGNTETAGTIDEITQGQVGGFIPVAGYELGFNLPLGDTFFVGFGATKISGSAELATATTGANHNSDSSFSLDISDHTTYWIQPSVSIYDNSAIFVKLGRSTADLDAFGQVSGKPNNLQGTTYGIGTQTIAGSGFFIKTEAGATQYDQIRVTGVGANASSKVEGDPIVAYGSVTVGDRKSVV